MAAETLARRGYPKYETVQNFIAADYKKVQVIELLLGIALKTVSNYLDHISTYRSRSGIRGRKRIITHIAEHG